MAARDTTPVELQLAHSDKHLKRRLGSSPALTIRKPVKGGLNALVKDMAHLFVIGTCHDKLRGNEA